MPSLDKPAFFDKYPDEAYRAQVENGNITPNDIELLNALNTRATLYKRVGLYGGAAVATGYARYWRKPRWSIPRTFAFSTVGAMTGVGIAAFATVRSLFSTMHQLEDKERFDKALIAIRAAASTYKAPPGQNGMRNRPQFELPARSAPAPERNAEQPFDTGASSAWQGASGASDDNSNGSSSYPPQETTNATPDQSNPEDGSRWSEVRNAQAQKQATAWDKLRQQQPTPAQTRSSRGGSSTPPNDSASDELKDQAAFDALLEAERNIGNGGSAGGGTSRWT